ncbi:MAG: hypothetical protein IJB52_03700 [Clostridia bacterium]|nr:hypothetical protein [Clostridia bacterium]
MNGITEKTLRDAVADALERGLPEDDADTFAEHLAAKAAVYNDPRFSDFEAMDSAIEAFIAGCPDLQNLGFVSRYVLAGLAVRGIALSNVGKGA